MSAFGFKVEGFAEIEAALASIRKIPTRKAALKRAMVAAAQPMAKLAEGMAPKRTGKLKASVTVSDKLSRRQASMAVKEPQTLYVYIGPDNRPQAITQEFGTVNHAPQPFMRPAWDQDNRAMLQRLADELRKEVFASLGRQRKR